jgi:hypothetical protein
MILEGYLALVKTQPAYEAQKTISKLDENVMSIGVFLREMREFVKQGSPDSELTSLVYSSKVKEYFTNIDLESELDNIQNSSVDFNIDNNITGYLLYMDGYFIQYIEGNTEDVEKLFLKIALDPRHSSITLLSHQKITARAFKKWTRLYRMEHHNQSQIPDVLKSIVAEKRLLSKTESLALVNFVSWLSEKDQSKVGVRGGDTQ